MAAAPSIPVTVLNTYIDRMVSFSVRFGILSSLPWTNNQNVPRIGLGCGWDYFGEPIRIYIPDSRYTAVYTSINSGTSLVRRRVVLPNITRYAPCHRRL
jgi:hypothetical protein